MSMAAIIIETHCRILVRWYRKKDVMLEVKQSWQIGVVWQQISSAQYPNLEVLIKRYSEPSSGAFPMTKAPEPLTMGRIGLI